MMVNDTENNEFRDLLSDYAAPIEDDGFAAHVLLQADAVHNAMPQKAALIKNIMIGGATLLATFIAAPQLGKLKQLLAEFRLPEISLFADLPINMSTDVLQTANTSSLTMLALLGVLMAAMAGRFLFGQDL